MTLTIQIKKSDVSSIIADAAITFGLSVGIQAFMFGAGQATYFFSKILYGGYEQLPPMPQYGTFKKVVTALTMLIKGIRD